MDISDNGAAGPPITMDQQKQHQTMMWQQNQYMGDSGIQSSVTTRVRAVVCLFSLSVLHHSNRSTV